MLIDQLIQTHTEKEAARLAQQEREKADLIQQLQAKIPLAFGELWQELQPHASKPFIYNERALYVELRVHIPGKIQFCIQSLDSGGVTVTPHPQYNSGYRDRVSVVDTNALAAFFSTQTAAYIEQQKEEAQKAEQQRLKRIDNLLNRFRYHVSCHTVDDMESGLAELITLDPDNADQYRTRFDDWLNDRATYDLDQRAKKQAEQDRDQAKQTFRQVVLAFWSEYDQVNAERDRLSAWLQEQFNLTTFRLWELDYGIKAYDEEEGDSIELRHAYVISDSPNDGYWPVVESNTITPTRFYNVASLRDLGQRTPSSAPVSFQFGYQRRYFSIAPGHDVDIEKYRALVAQTLPELPTMPDPDQHGLTDLGYTERETLLSHPRHEDEPPY